MDPAGQILTYSVPTVPDPACPAYQAAAGGDVRRAVVEGRKHLLRTVANMPVGSCFLGIIFDFDPAAGKEQGRQSRLKLHLRLWGSSVAIAGSLDKLVMGSPLSRLYRFERVERPLHAREPSRVSCSIIRRTDLIEPLHTCDFNSKIPKRYFVISQFVPKEDDDGMILDGVLDGIDEPVTIDIRVRPVDISALLRAHTAYLACLQSINRDWDPDSEDSGGIDFAGLDSHRYTTSRSQISPLSYRDPLANDIFQAEHTIHKTLLLPHLSFCVRVQARTEPVAMLISSVLAESGFDTGSYRIVMSEGNGWPEEISGATGGASATPSPASEHASGDPEAGDLASLSGVATVDELAGIFGLPVASSSCSPLCCRKNTDPPHVDEKDLIVLGYDKESLTGNGSPMARGIDKNALKKHLSSFGLPGMGKTTSNINILAQLSSKGIPFLVIECAKREYRVLKTLRGHSGPEIRDLANKLEVYTVGEEKVSPFRFNFLDVLSGVEIAEHIENLMYCIKASIPVSAGSLPALLLEALEELYEDYDRREHPPVIADLIETIKRVLARKGYSTETRSDMQTATETRLGILDRGIIGKTVQCRHGITVEHLLAVPCIIEMDVLPADQMRLLVLFILVYVRLYLKTMPISSGLRYVILLEEAHVIFGRRSGGAASEEMADTDAAIADVISRMLVELRALGVGVILSDQHPSALDPAAVKSVGSILAFRQVHSEDREELGSSMLFKEVQMQEIARLRPGEAFFFTEGYFGPQRIVTPNLGE